MADIVGKIIAIRFVNRGRDRIDQQMQRNIGGLAGIAPRFRRLTTDPTSFMVFDEAVHIIRSFQEGKYFTRAYLEMEICVGDIIVTGKGVGCAAELILGGRVGISPDSSVCIESERLVRNMGNTRAFFRKGGFWSDGTRLNEPLEIQTNGGVFGIKG